MKAFVARLVLSEDLHRRITGSELVVYPDPGHGGIFPFHEEFVQVVAAFVADRDSRRRAARLPLVARGHRRPSVFRRTQMTER